MNMDDGGPAFPIHDIDDLGGHRVREWGMSLRDWFAGQALATIDLEEMLKRREMDGSYGGPRSFGYFADIAYGIADAMLAARQNGGDA